MDIEKRLLELELQMKEELKKDNPNRTLLVIWVSEAMELDRILSARKWISNDILEFMVKEGVITIKEKEDINIIWENTIKKNIKDKIGEKFEK